jgi:hypothetical protein
MSGISRRELFGMGIGAVATAGVAPLAFASTTAAPQSGLAQDARDYAGSVAKALTFLNTMMDGYATGSTVRLSQSYSDQEFAPFSPVAFTYDNAVAIHAYLVHGDAESLTRAQVLGDGLIEAQAANFPIADGRFAQAYYVNVANADGAYITPAAFPFYFYGSAVGDQAWAGMALSQLYRRTGKSKYVTAAVTVANWIVANTYNTLGPGGYSYGTIIDSSNASEPSGNGKSTEHNIDTYAFFTMLDELTHHGKASNGASWASLAAHALSFVMAMYNATDGYFYTGTLSDQITINPQPIPEDCQTWSYLALLDNRYKGTIDWALANLQTTDTSSARNSNLTGSETITGMVYDTASLSTPVTSGDDPNAVWLEGTAHTIAALTARAIAGRDSLPRLFQDLSTALSFLHQSQTAQAELGVGQKVNGSVIPAGEGLLAATSLMDTGFGFSYLPSLHIGATGWYLLAALGGNPFQLGYVTVPRIG